MTRCWCVSTQALFDSNDHAILERLLATEADVGAAFQVFEFSRAVQALYTFFWTDFCDWYVEVSKAKLQDPAQRETCLAIQDLVLRQVLLLLHPFTPFITEELWHRLGYGGDDDFIQNQPPGCGRSLGDRGIKLDADAVRETGQLREFVVAARALKADHNLAAKKDVRFFAVVSDAAWSAIDHAAPQLTRLIGASSIERREAVEGAPAALTPFGTIHLDLASSLDPGIERERLGKELDKIEKAITGTRARLANPAFTAKAPPAVIDGARKQLADNEARRDEIVRLLTAVG